MKYALLPQFKRFIILVCVCSLVNPALGQAQQSPTGPQQNQGVGAGNNANSPLNQGGNANNAPRSRASQSNRESSVRNRSDRGVLSDPNETRTRGSKESESSRESVDKSTTTVSGGGGDKASAPSFSSYRKDSATGGRPNVKKGAGQGASVLGTGTFEPIEDRKIEYGPLPNDGEDQLITEVGPMSVAEFLELISVATSWDILVTDSAKMVSLEFWLNEKTPQEAMRIFQFHDVFYRWNEESKFLEVMTHEEWRLKEFLEVESIEFDVKHADILYVESFAQALLSSHGRLITDHRNNRIYVWDTPDNLEYMEKIVTEVDVPLTEQEFLIEHVELMDVEGVVSSLLSPNGSVLTDARSGQVFVWDNPTNMEQIASTIEQLDVPVHSKTFEIQHVNAEDVVDSLEVLMSERGLIQVDPRYNTIVATDLPNRVERMAAMIETLDRELSTQTWVVKYTDIDFIADQLESYVPEEMGDIVVNEETHQITVTGLPSRLAQIDSLISEWDQKRSQVHIEAYIVEINQDIERQFDINWSYLEMMGSTPFSFRGGAGFSRTDSDGNAVNPTHSNSPMSIGQLPTAFQAYGDWHLDENNNLTRDPLVNLDGNPVIDSLKGNKLGVTLDYLDRNDKATILAKPQVTVQDGQEAAFQNSTKVPFVSSTTTRATSSVSNNGFNNRSQIEFIDVGTILAVLPRISEDENILLDISAEDSSFVFREIISNGQISTVPEKTERLAETQVLVHTGETIVLGGLRNNRITEGMNKTPLLGELPIVGRIFRYPRKQVDNNSLLIFITPTIVDEYTHPESEMLTKAEDNIANFTRKQDKGLWGRIQSKLTKGNNEIGVSVGQGGAIFSEGMRVTLEELEEAFKNSANGLKVKVVLRPHPAAPDEVIDSIRDLAISTGLSLVEDHTLMPIVPSAAKS